MGHPVQRPESSRCMIQREDSGRYTGCPIEYDTTCIILCSCTADEGARQPTITRRRLGRYICGLLLSYRQLLHSLTVRFCHAMTSVLFSCLLHMILSGCDFTVLEPMATGQSARASQCCYQATCLTPQTNVNENQ